MNGLITDEALERVRSATDIVELVSQHVSLKKSGANYLGLCPFHQEKTPSFTVSPSKQIFHCFGCGAGGDAVGFVMRQGNYSFPDAVQFLADRAGIELPERTAGSRSAGEDWDKLIAANEAAAKFYQERLWNSPDGKKALNIFISARKAMGGGNFKDGVHYGLKAAGFQYKYSLLSG